MPPCEWFGVSIIVTLTTHRMQEVCTCEFILLDTNIIYNYFVCSNRTSNIIFYLLNLLHTHTYTHKQTHKPTCTYAHQTHAHTHEHTHTQSHCTAVPRWVQTVLSVFQFPRHTTAATAVPADGQSTLAVCLRSCVKGWS